jgi:hypothetical protein
VPESGVLARRNSKPPLGCPREAKGLHAPVCSTCSAMPRRRHLGSGRTIVLLARIFRSRAREAQKTRSAELCNPRYQRRAPVLGEAAARLTNAKLVPNGELCASTAAKLASAGLSCRGGRTFSARSRAHSGPTSDASSPATLPPIPQCGHSFRAADQDRFHRRHAEWHRLPRSKTPSTSKEPGRLFTLAAILFGTAGMITTLLHPLRIHRAGLGPAHRSQPRPRTASWTQRRLPTSATISQNTGTPSERPFLARSSPFRRSSLPRRQPRLRAARHRKALLEPPSWRPKMPAAPAGKLRVGLRAVAPEADSNTCRAPPVTDLPSTGPDSFPALRADRPRPGSDLPRERLRSSPSRGAWDRPEPKRGR